MPAQRRADQGVRGYDACFGNRRGQRYVAYFDTFLFSCCLDQWTQHSGMDVAQRYVQDLGIGELKVQRIERVTDILVSSEDVQIFVGIPGGQPGAELRSRLVALKVAVIHQIAGRDIPKVAIDILRRLLAAYAQAVA